MFLLCIYTMVSYVDSVCSYIVYPVSTVCDLALFVPASHICLLHIFPMVSMSAVCSYIVFPQSSGMSTLCVLTLHVSSV